MGTYERKTREIKRSLHRRARMRRAYFKMIGEDPKKATAADVDSASIDAGHQIDLSDVSGSEDEGAPAPTAKNKKAGKSEQKTAAAEKKLTGRQLARNKRSEEYHRRKEQEESAARARHRRESHKHTMQKRNQRGQPKLGSQVGVLLDKIRKTT